MHSPQKIWLMAILLFATPASALTEITLYSPYEFEPFLIDGDHPSGLMFDLQKMLNKRQSKDFSFAVKYIPRARLVLSLDGLKDCAVPFVSPAWFDDAPMKKYGWTKSLYADENVILSPRQAPIDSLDPSHITGKNTQTVLGHKDPILDPLIEKGVVNSSKTNSLRNTVMMVAKGRLDFIVSGRLILNYLVNSMRVNEQIHFGTIPAQRFERRILLCKDSDPRLKTWLDRQVEELQRDENWKAIMRIYQNPDT